MADAPNYLIAPGQPGAPDPYADPTLAAAAQNIGLTSQPPPGWQPPPMMSQQPQVAQAAQNIGLPPPAPPMQMPGGDMIGAPPPQGRGPGTPAALGGDLGTPAPPPGVINMPVQEMKSEAGQAPGAAPWLKDYMDPAWVQKDLPKPPRPLTLGEKVAQAQQDYLGSFDEKKQGITDAAEIKAANDQKIALMNQRLAEKQQRDAAIAADAQETAERRQREMMAATDRMNEQLSKQKVDPSRYFKNMDDGHRLMFVIGASLGGYLQGIGATQGNTFLDHADKMIDRDIAAQESDLKNQREGINQRNTMFSQFMQVSGDSRLASLQTRNAMYEGMKNQIAAQASSLGTQETLANAKMMVNDVDQKQKETQMQMAQEAKRVADAHAAAAAAAQREQNERLFQHAVVMDQHAIEREQHAVELAKIDAMKNKPGKAAVSSEQEQAFQHATDKVMAIGKEAARTSPVDAFLANNGAATWGTSRLFPGATANVDKTMQYNQGVPAVLRLMGDRVPPELLHEQAAPYLIEPGMSDAQKQARLASFNEFIRTTRGINLGAKKGSDSEAEAPVPASATRTEE